MGWNKYGRTDALLQAYDRGPFPALQVADWPPALVELVTRQTGRSFEEIAPVLAEYERIKAFLGFEAVQLDGGLVHQQWVEDPHPTRATVEPTPAPVSPLRIQEAGQQEAQGVGLSGPSSGVFDPNDLGD